MSPSWIPQSKVSSCSASALGRTSWLAELRPAALSAIDAYFARHPAGEDVTREVLRALGPADLERLSGGRGLGQAKIEVGMWVPQLLVERYGAAAVETWRAERRAKPMPNRDGTVGWVKSYTRHRVTGLAARA